MDKQFLEKEFNLEKKDLDLLINFMNYVLEENKKFNLTSITNENDFIEKHLIDSLFLNKFVNLENKKVLDFGTGAGFPGVPLAITNKKTFFTLVDSNAKKISFIENFVKQEKIKNIILKNERIEKENQQFDFVLARAVSNLSVLLEISCHLVKKNGYLVFYKGPSYKEEMIDEEILKEELGLKLEKIEKYSLSKQEHFLLFFKKISKEKDIYPRDFSKIKQTPFWK